jgi:predicted DNA-binding ribbon-helix-helix protein
VATVERGRESGNLSSTLRLFVLDSYRQRAAGRASEGQNGAGASSAVSQAPS